MFVTIIDRFTQKEDFDIFVTSVVSDKNAYVITSESARNGFLNNLKNKRYCVVRVIVERINQEGINEYHCFDCHGDHFIIADLDNVSRSDHRLTRWIETIDCNIRNGINRSFKEIRVFTNQFKVDDYTLLNLDEEQINFHDKVRSRLGLYFKQ